MQTPTSPMKSRKICFYTQRSSPHSTVWIIVFRMNGRYVPRVLRYQTVPGRQKLSSSHFLSRFEYLPTAGGLVKIPFWLLYSPKTNKAKPPPAPPHPVWEEDQPRAQRCGGPSAGTGGSGPTKGSSGFWSSFPPAAWSVMEEKDSWSCSMMCTWSSSLSFFT